LTPTLLLIVQLIVAHSPAGRDDARNSCAQTAAGRFIFLQLSKRPQCLRLYLREINYEFRKKFGLQDNNTIDCGVQNDMSRHSQVLGTTCEQKMSGAENGAERAENRVSGSGAVSGIPKMAEREGR